MVNSKSQQNYKEYNSYYRPNKDDDDLTFIPSQGVLPRYYFEDGFLRGTVEPQTQQIINFLEDEEYKENNNPLYFFIFIFIMVYYFFNNFFKSFFTFIRKKF